MCHHSRLFAAFPLLLAVSASAQAQVAELRYDLRVDVPVTVVATAAWIGSEVLKAHLAAQSCRWCDANPDGSDALNSLDAAVRRGLRWPNIDAGDTASGVTSFVLAPLAALGLVALAEWRDDALSRFPIDALLIAEAAAIASSLNQVVKFAAGRERPFVHVLPSEQKATTAAPADNNTSFYSGHTNFAFALAVASGTVASLRGYRWAHWVWIVGLAVATATGYLRIAGDRHYFTDVVTGAAVGSAVGFLTPWLFHARAESKKVPTVGGAMLPGGGLLIAGWTW